MFEEGTLVKTIGAFRVIAVTDNFVELDPYGKGSEVLNEIYTEKGFVEFDENGNAKNYDGFKAGDFFAFGGTYPIVRSNGVFSKIEVEGMLLSIPNHKLEEVL